MLTSQTIQTVKATAPVLAEHGFAIISRFYERLFAAHPELMSLFNMRHQERGEHQRALADAVVAYAAHIDNLPALQDALARITHKHASLDVQPQQYAVLGRHLLAAIKEVLGDAASDDILGAWAQACQELTDMLIAAAAALYDRAAAAPGGWRGWRNFVVRHRRQESELITSFFLEPEDGERVADFEPGQYVSVAVDVPRLGLQQVRQYSLSDAPNGKRYRISVTRESEDAQRDAGDVSSQLHDHLNQGDLVRLTPPFGVFHLDMQATTPVVLVSSGAGLAPLVSMLKTLLKNTERQLVFVHGTCNSSVHAMKDRISAVVETNRRLTSVVFYDAPLPTDEPGYDYDHEGFVDLRRIEDQIMVPHADYYVCGPIPFMRMQVEALRSLGVQDSRIHCEAFGTDVLGIPLRERNKFRVMIENTGEIFYCNEDVNVLAAMEQASCHGVPVGCRNGGCGACKVRIISGSFQTRKMNRAVLCAAEEIDGCVLACKTYPRGDLVVRALGQVRR